MGTLNVTVGLTPAYSSRLVNISATQVTIVLPLVDGDHVVTTPLTNVGILMFFSDPVLLASLTVWYNYSSLTNTLTFCANNLVSSDSTYLTTVPRSTNQSCRQHTYPGDNIPCGSNQNWNYTTPLTPGLQTALQQTVQRANSVIIELARIQGFTVVVRTPPPVLSKEDYENLLLVYYKGKFLESYNPNKEYDNDHSLLTMESVWYGEIYLQGNESFANVIGSTGDPKIASKTWIKLWSNQFGAPTTCSSLNFNGFACSNPMVIVGGHVILGTTAANVPAGSNNVFIMPICCAHNSNNNVHMEPLQYQKGIALHNYLQ